jgi:heme/copper-type cytochrome/quinol oxidase subunit 2
MIVLYIVLGFLVPVILVFGYSVWLHRRRQNSDTTETGSDTENKTVGEHK